MSDIPTGLIVAITAPIWGTIVLYVVGNCILAYEEYKLLYK